MSLIPVERLQVTASQLVVTPDDRDVLYTSLSGGTISTWTAPLAGGHPTKLVDGGAAAVSPDGRTLAFVAMGWDQGIPVGVCALPGCRSPRAIGGAAFDTAIPWTPDGRGVALARNGNLWMQSPGEARCVSLTRFTDPRPIAACAWSRDGKRLAVTCRSRELELSPPQTREKEGWWT